MQTWAGGKAVPGRASSPLPPFAMGFVYVSVMFALKWTDPLRTSGGVPTISPSVSVKKSLRATY